MTDNNSNKWYEGIAGLGPNFSLFSPPPWVDTTKPPGHTSQTPSMKNSPEWRVMFSGMSLIYSMNLLWLSIAVFVYIIFPYDYEVAMQWDINFGRWIARRAMLNVTLVYLWYGFWHGSLYGLGWGERPFNANRGQYRWSKLMHNLYYTTLGTLQWTGWEAIMVHCYATGRMPYLSDDEAWSSPLHGIPHFILWTIAVPLFREVHFYFAHRLIHIKSFYTYVHAVHHRNTDIEPFSGICMHPIEHMYYFTSIAPSLYFRMTPFAFLWNGIHLIISPAASHSGYEDHCGSDQYHYLHHRHFECNYGTPSLVLDNVFGTFRDKISTTKSDTYRGDADGVGNNTASTLDRKASLLGWPAFDQFIFDALFCILIPSLFVIALVDTNSSPFGGPFGLAFLVAIGPVIGGILLILIKSLIKATKRGKSESLRRQLSYPFHKEDIGGFGMHLIVGFVLAILPAYHLFHMALSEPGHGAYFQLRRYA